MTNFVEGFLKTAGVKNLASKGKKAAKALGKGKGKEKGFFDTVGTFFKGVTDGAQSSGNVALKTHLNPMTGLKNLGKAIDAKNMNVRGQFIGRALPSLGATAAYGYGAKKIFDGVSSANSQQNVYAPYYGQS